MRGTDTDTHARKRVKAQWYTIKLRLNDAFCERDLHSLQQYVVVLMSVTRITVRNTLTRYGKGVDLHCYVLFNAICLI